MAGGSESYAVCLTELWRDLGHSLARPVRMRVRVPAAIARAAAERLSKYADAEMTLLGMRSSGFRSSGFRSSATQMIINYTPLALLRFVASIRLEAHSEMFANFS